MTKTKILHSLAEQISRQYKLHAHYMSKDEEAMASDALRRAWSIYWCGLDLLGDGYQEKLDAVRQSAREDGVRMQELIKTL